MIDAAVMLQRHTGQVHTSVFAMHVIIRRVLPHSHILEHIEYFLLHMRQHTQEDTRMHARMHTYLHTYTYIRT